MAACLIYQSGRPPLCGTGIVGQMSILRIGSCRLTQRAASSKMDAEISVSLRYEPVFIVPLRVDSGADKGGDIYAVLYIIAPGDSVLGGEFCLGEIRRY
ncbi:MULTISPECIES: hypothetical protein [Megasphaera]|uniref:hypothetical protein n=1 Tax=Megasphaera TaxID=906 RepID=UPI000403AD0F|nr:MULTISPECIES: hypothetical protein [Megasphaera]